MSNKRQHNRFDSSNLIHFNCLDKSDKVSKQGMGRTLNVSESGILLETSFQIRDSQNVSMAIGLDNDMVSIRGIVVRSTEGNNDRFEAGIQFFEVGTSDRDLLRKYIDAFTNQ